MCESATWILPRRWSPRRCAPPRPPNSLPSKLGVLNIEGERRLALGDITRGLALLGLAWHHPVLASDGRTDIQGTLDFWIPKLGISQQDVEAKMEAGRSLDLEVVFREIHKELP